MSNHKAHFRGDIQVDGSIVGPDGQPVGGSVDVSGLLPVDGSRAMTGPLKFGPTEIDPIWNGYAVAVESDTHDFGDFVVGNPNGDSYVEIYSVDDPSSTNLLLQAANNNYVSAVANSLGAALAVHNDTTFARLSTTYGLELDLQPDALGIAMRDNTVDFNYYRWQVTPHGEIHWGGGSAAPDVSLTRTGPGSMEFTNPSGTYGTPGLSMFGAGSGLYAHDDADWTNYSALTPNHLLVSGVDGSVTILQDGFSLYNVADGGFTTLVSHPAEGVLELLNGGSESASALRLHSPDGTAYDIKVANGGALSAVAA